MEQIIKKDNRTMYYLNDELLLTITDLFNNDFHVENQSYTITGNCKNIDEYETEFSIYGMYDNKKKRTMRKNQNMFKHNSKWFVYILKEKGFIQKTKLING